MGLVGPAGAAEIRAPQLNEGADILGDLAGNDPGPLGQLAMLLVRARPAFERALMGLGGAPNASQGIAPIFAPVMTGKIPHPPGPVPYLLSNLRAPGVRPPLSPHKEGTLRDIHNAMGRLLSRRNPIVEADPQIRKEFQGMNQRAYEAPGWSEMYARSPRSRAIEAARNDYQSQVSWPGYLGRFSDEVMLDPNLMINTGRRLTPESRPILSPMLSMKSEAWFKPVPEIKRNREIQDTITQLDRLRSRFLWP